MEIRRLGDFVAIADERLRRYIPDYPLNLIQLGERSRSRCFGMIYWNTDYFLLSVRCEK